MEAWEKKNTGIFRHKGSDYKLFTPNDNDKEYYKKLFK